eukprot:6520939-Pyramimonas_sp.AAC.2
MHTVCQGFSRQRKCRRIPRLIPSSPTAPVPENKSSQRVPSGSKFPVPKTDCANPVRSAVRERFILAETIFQDWSNKAT